VSKTPMTSGDLPTNYEHDFKLFGIQRHKILLFVAAVALIGAPFVASPLQLDLANQVFLAGIGALSLMLLTGYAGQISLGHAGLLAAGAFTAGILYKEAGAPFWVTLPASAVVGGLLGLIFGLPSLRLRGVYLAVSTLALHFVVVYLGGEYETERGFSTGILVDPPMVFGFEVYGGRIWYFVLLVALALTLLLCRNLLRSRSGRAWGAIHTKETVAEALGISVPKYKLFAFVISSAITAVAGALFAYYRGFVSVEAFSLYLSIQYVAMIIIGGMGSLLGAILGAIFVTLFPYGIEKVLLPLLGTDQAGSAFAAIYAAFGAVMIFFLAFEPQGLIGLWRRVKTSFAALPFHQRKTSGSDQ
jgi:branched-chain amino acid transport system permease protein